MQLGQIVKNHRGISSRQEAAAERALFQAILTLRSVEESRDFFRDLCTPAELQALADRWMVVGLLQGGMPYREISKQTGVSVTTIGRVANLDTLDRMILLVDPAQLLDRIEADVLAKFGRNVSARGSKAS